jgi:exosortase
LPPAALLQSAPRRARIQVQDLVFFCLMAGVVACFWADLRGLISLSLNRDEYSHVILIPFVSALLIYMQRKAIFSYQEFSIRVGLPLILGGVLLRLSLVSLGSPSQFWAVFAVLLVVFGAFAACYGRLAFRAAMFPLLFLIFMAPLPNGALDHAIYALQCGSAEISEVFYRVLGIPVFRQGFVFALPGVTIEVAKECSGIRSSLALLITTVLSAHLLLRSNWKKMLLCLLVVPIAVLKNGIRIVSLSTLAAYVNPIFLTGPIHHQGGVIFFAMGLASLGAVLAVLRRTEITGLR